MLANNPNEFDMIRIGLASPERIRFWSHGEVEKPETINYRTFRPERKGLFCEKIFGPVKDWECSCGKYRRVRYRGIVCERCGVEVTHSKVRRERMGHIELASPVSHIWYFKGIPSYLGLILDMSSRLLEEVIYYDSYIVTDVSKGLKGKLDVCQLLSEQEFLDLKEKHSNDFKAGMGAAAIRTILQGMDLAEIVKGLRVELKDAKGQKRLKVTKRLRIFEALLKSGNRPEWMVLDCVPVMPPDLRPMVQLEGGRFATSDLNDLYRRVVNRNNRLKRLIDIGAPDMIVRNEKRMLQEAVDVLISNGKRGRSVTGSNGRPLKSLGNIIEGKQGRFRQNLLGKRVDYSGRSVIVVGPKLKFHQCGLPKEMALELFKPFVIRRLVEKGFVQNVKSAKRMIERRETQVWDVLEDVIKGHPVLLNRAPTLHRLGIQAFEPILVEGKAIQIHPLVCTGYNADFDGDQMAVHVPLSLEAQTEARILMMSTNNILSPSNGRSIITPSQDMVLGCYYLTFSNEQVTLGKGMAFSSPEEATKAYENHYLHVQAPITVKYLGERLQTTLGRLVLNQALREITEWGGVEPYPYINEGVDKRNLGKLINHWYELYGNDVTSRLADRLKDLGFVYATLAGISISVFDMVIPETKKEILRKAGHEVAQLDRMAHQGTISRREGSLRSKDIWRAVTVQITQEMEKSMGLLNNVYIMANSGARGSIDQVRQLAGMRGLMADAQGNTIDIPIKSNFREGLTLTEYFISCYGARKGLVDTALRTADSGYLTRRLVDIAQDLMIIMPDCSSTEGVSISSVKEGINVIMPLSERLVGRMALQDVCLPGTKSVIVKKGSEISEEAAKAIQDAGIDSVKVRSVFTCKAGRGICQKCYGRDLSSGKLINLGEAIGIIAAQSIGEPGTQLTMRTFHTGGVDLSKAAVVHIHAKHAGKIELEEALNVKVIQNERGESCHVATREGSVFIHTEDGVQRAHLIPQGSMVMVKNGQKVDSGIVLAAFDQAYEYIISENAGIARFFNIDPLERKDDDGRFIETVARKDGEIFVFNPKAELNIEMDGEVELKVKEGDRIKSDTDLGGGTMTETGGIVTKIRREVVNRKGTDDEISIVNIAPGESYPILAGARLYIEDKSKVNANDILARERAMQEGAARDIVAGLPRVEELFEARKPKDAAILSEMSGVVDILEKEGMRHIVVATKEDRREYKVPFGIRVKVFSGKSVRKGDQLTEGVINPHDILVTRGINAAQTYLGDSVQKVYRGQGVRINDKHIEVIVRQMTRKISITGMGDTELLPNEYIDINEFDRINQSMEEENKLIAAGERVLLGITKASLNTESFISASSFQETARVLAEAAIKGKVDEMYGLKENVIIGKLISAGTGMPKYNQVKLKSLTGEKLERDVEEELFEEEMVE